MDAALVTYGVLVGSCSFAAAYAVLPWSAQGARKVTRRPPDVDWGEVLGTLRSLPVAKLLSERSGTSRMRTECLRQMPVMLDVLTLGLSAGLSFDSSLELYCHRYDNVLSRAMGSAMLSWRLGTQSRDAALIEVARRLNVSSLDRFAGVVSQALAFGAPLAVALEQQAQAIRDEQRAQVEEEIERVPVKMLIPMGTLIVPAMLLAILGPLLGASLSMG